MSWWQRFFSTSSGCSSSVPLSKHEVGRMGEDAAAQHLKKCGMRIVHRNWRAGSLELDLVCEDAQGIIFVEVKTRKNTGMTTPEEGIQYKKKASFIKAAQAWLMAHESTGAYEKPCRFAVVAVLYDVDTNQDYNFKVVVYDHAFDLS